MVHRDIKPANVLVDEATQVTKLRDMGLSKLKSAPSVSHTTSTGIPGTPSYYLFNKFFVIRVINLFKNFYKIKKLKNSHVWSVAVTLFIYCSKKETAGERTSRLRCTVGVSQRERECPYEEREPRSLGLLSTTVGDSLQDTNSFPGFSPARPTERERERPWKTLVAWL